MHLDDRCGRWHSLPFVCSAYCSSFEIEVEGVFLKALIGLWSLWVQSDYDGLTVHLWAQWGW